MVDRPLFVDPTGSRPYTDAEMADYNARNATATAIPAPDAPTLGDWCRGLLLWGRYDQVTTAVNTLKASNDPAKAMQGRLIEVSLDKANNVYRKDLMAFKDALGFTEADVDESLWRAARVASGDLTSTGPATPSKT